MDFCFLSIWLIDLLIGMKDGKNWRSSWWWWSWWLIRCLIGRKLGKKEQKSKVPLTPFCKPDDDDDDCEDYIYDGDADGNDDGFDDDDYELWLNDAYNFARKLGKKKQRFRLWRQKFLSGLSAIGLDVEEVRKFNDKEKTFWSIIKFCLAICKLTNIPIFAIYIYGISHHVCLLIHVHRASLKHTWPPTKEGQSNKVQKPNRTIPLHSISLPLLSRLCRRWTARVETTSTSSSCMHRGRCCAGTLGGY